MESPSIYIPMDRRQAMARGIHLPQQTQGAALFADISGFTSLTEALARALGPQRGAEELTHCLNLVYDALVAEVDRYGGTVISFAGDAITGWFDGDDGLRATTVALAMQQAMQQFKALPIPHGGTIELAMKAAVAVGTVRRFVVGDPHIMLQDVLVGRTLERMAAAERQANKDEVVLDAASALALGDRLQIAEWRSAEDDGARVAVVAKLHQSATPTPWPTLAPNALSDDQIRPWLLPPVYAQAASEQGEFLAELRPAVSLFLRFDGIDYEYDAAADKLDLYIRWVQSILARYEGYLLHLTVGDKGSYLYAAFGAPIAHGDDPRRAAAAALALQTPPPELGYIHPVQVGITRGRMRTGPYGSSTRRTYSIIGDATNVAARLMQYAAPGQILVTEAIAEATHDWFRLERLPSIRVKGKTDPIQVFALQGQKATKLQAMINPLPMVGREAEMALIEAKLEEASQGRGQIIGITGEAGIGKSRLVAEAVRLAERSNVQVLAGAAQSYGTNNSYLVWEPIWQSFFGVAPEDTITETIDTLEQALRALDSALLPRLPLLGPPLNIPLPDNDLMRTFDAKLRKASTEALLIDLLRARARQAGPLLLILEDAHWIDPLSHDLLEAIGRAIFDAPVLILIAYRPPELERVQAPRVASLPYFTPVPLRDFTPVEAERLIRLKLEQLTGAEAEAPTTLVERVTTRSHGNPFYIEELLNYLHDIGIDPQDAKALAALHLPTNLHSLILSRIDQLTESQKITIKVASVIGRVFQVVWLWGVYPQLGQPAHVRADLERLSHLDLTPLDQPEPDLTYIFKHIATHEVAYDSLLLATRSQFHGQLGQYIETTYRDSLEQYLDLLAFHFERSPDAAKKREYLQRAGEAAQAAYANESAIDYYRRLLLLLAEHEQAPVLLKLGQVLELVSEWTEAEALYQSALRLATRTQDHPVAAQAHFGLGTVLKKRGDYSRALAWLEEARQGYELLHNPAGVSRVLVEIAEVYRLRGEYPQAEQHYTESLRLAESAPDENTRLTTTAMSLKGAGTLAAYRGDYTTSRSLFERSLAMLQTLGDKPNVANLLNNLGIVARFVGDFAAAQHLYEQSLTLLRELGDRMAISATLNNLGLVVRYAGDNTRARRLLEESVVIKRRLGEKWGLANTLSSLGEVALDEGDLISAHTYLHESLRLNHELGDRTAIAFALEYWAGLAAAQLDPTRALWVAGTAHALRESVGSALTANDRAKLETRLEPARRALGAADAQRAWAEGLAMPLDVALAKVLE